MRYLVDTNVVSELVKKNPHEGVVAWLEGHAADLYLCAVTIEEMRFGALMLPKGKRRTKLEETIDQIVTAYGSRTFSFDARAAELCAQFHVKAVGCGRTPTIEDLMIGGICAVQDAVLVTRNVKDFDYMDIEVLNPFEAE
jgi:predicted nucleic acid-binding protein